MNTEESRRCPYCQSWSGSWRPVEHSISHWPYILNVRTEGWTCYSCRQKSFEDDVTEFFEKMANKLRAGDLNGFTSLGGDYYYTSYKPAKKHDKPLPPTPIHKPDLSVSDKPIEGRRDVLPLIKPVIFRINAPGAKSVSLVGKFRGAEFNNYLMKRTVDGYWEFSVELKRGHYEYHFIVDGVPTDDPRAVARVPNGSNGFNSVVDVG